MFNCCVMYAFNLCMCVCVCGAVLIYSELRSWVGKTIVYENKHYIYTTERASARFERLLCHLRAHCWCAIKVNANIVSV